MKDLILNTPRDIVQVELTQEQLTVLKQVVSFFEMELRLGVSLAGSNERLAVVEQIQQAIREAK